MENILLQSVWFVFGQAVLTLACYAANGAYKREKSGVLNVLRIGIYTCTFIFFGTFVAKFI